MTFRTAILLAVIPAVIFTFPGHTNAQGRGTMRGGQGWGSGGQYGRIYDVTTVETLEGDVVTVERFDPGPNMTPGVHLMLRSGDKTISVHLGPAWYVENQERQLEAGDNVRVEGPHVMYKGAEVLIAARVTRGDETLVLRDQDGIPAWSGWRGRGTRGRRRP